MLTTNLEVIHYAASTQIEKLAIQYLSLAFGYILRFQNCKRKIRGFCFLDKTKESQFVSRIRISHKTNAPIYTDQRNKNIKTGWIK